MWFKKKEKKPRQYTKIIMDTLICLSWITVLSGIYINFKNGFSMDSIVASILDMMKYVVPSYACKSFFETYEEKKLDFLIKMKELGLSDVNRKEENNDDRLE